MQTRRRPVVLFVAEAVTLAHFARIATLARALDRGSYDVVVTTDPRFTHLDGLSDVTFRPIQSIPSAQFTEALAAGRPIYDESTLERYVADDITLLREVKPDLVVGDFRLSLAVSAPVVGVPYAAVVNAYWSPYAEVVFPVPDVPITRLVGVRLGQAIFDRVRPMVFRAHAKPLNRVRKRHGLPAIPGDLRSVYSWGDYTLYADIPELVAMRSLPADHRHIGAPLWSASVPFPRWWPELPTDKPVVLISLGSSGPADLLAGIISELAKHSVTVVAATAGRVAIGAQSTRNVYTTDYLPLAAAAARSALLICNGGSLSTYQAIACGVPILGLCANMDQLLNMQSLERLGVGLLCRASGSTSRRVAVTARLLLEDTSFARAAQSMRNQLASIDVNERFRGFIREVLP